MIITAALGGTDWPRRLAVPTLVLILGLSLPLRRHWILAGWLLLGSAMLWLDWRGNAHWVLDSVPILINAGLCWLFARTLRHGHEPLVTRIVRILDGEVHLQSPGVARYARSVTTYWAMLTGLQCVLLGACWVLLWQRAATAWWAHAWLQVGGYALPVLAMVIEYGVRRWRFRTLPHASLPVFVRRLMLYWPRILDDADASMSR